ncbi:2-hydroxyacid dehydrogenase [Burkholderia gladioli]|uniref:2-hydroxyacid dehydrogenase n=1 Tax=Burkholderia gladioli TaxID=28095 RepID=UPI001C2205D4|nr:2-hydroxyacid dehydrogenase [Burkholderia gladioli]MBU9681880.1 2-hydroxyacid dehydrogenase [Burkholderia gladioli]
MPHPNVLQIGEFPSAQQDIIDAEVRRYAEEDLQRDPAVSEGIEAILTRSSYQVPASLLASLPNLKIIATSGVGFDGIPLDAARSRGVVVTNTPGVLDAAVCELAIGLLLSLLRRIPSADRFVRDEAWAHELFPLTSSLAGKRIGIVGLGRIGQGIARRLAGFDVEIAYCGSKVEGLPYAMISDVRELASFADILIVCCPGGDRTRHLIDGVVLSALGSSSFLVNVSRGTVVDEAALIDALENGLIRGAALDVFEKEPLIGSRLTTLSNVVLTPHAGSATEETRHTMLRLALDNIHRVLDGSCALTPVK